VAERHPGVVAYGEIDDVLVDAHGDYPRWLPGDDGKTDLVRKPDGWHVCPDGAVRIAAKVVQLSAWVGLSPPPRDGWQDGAWRSTERYDDPKGGCDPSAEDNRPPSS
jgi:hypothetical protein